MTSISQTSVSGFAQGRDVKITPEFSVAVDAEKNALLVKGAVPGPNKGLVTVRTAVKVQKSKPQAKTLIDYTASAE